MSKLLIKTLYLALTIFLTEVVFFSQVSYPNLWEILLTALVLAIAVQKAEEYLPQSDIVWNAAAIEFVIAAVVLYLSGLLFPRAGVTIMGAFITAFLIAMVEHIQPIFALLRHHSRKSPAD
jgi:uncharacterized membrane protein YvlD (DUF360 family)